jgi:hypothetical protein
MSVGIVVACVMSMASADAVEVQPDSDESRSASRLHVMITGGIAGARFALSPELGPGFVVGKPLYLGTRREHAQFVIDTHVSAELSLPSKSVTLTLSPTVGANFYFGRFFGLEIRGGIGFAARLESVSRMGLGIIGSGALAFRPFDDDRTRIKLGAYLGDQIFFTGGARTFSLGLAAGFEMAL